MKSFLIITIITVISSVNSQTFDANAYCSTLASRLYPYPGGTDCTQYVKCFSNGVSIVGAVYTCMGTTLFNPALLYCQSGYVCVPATTTTLLPSTSTSTSSSTTTPAPTVTSTSTLTSTTTLVPSTTRESSTTSSTTTTESTTQTMQHTTTSAAFNANNFCASQVSGRYPVGTDCTQYVVCYSNGVSMMGIVYTCSGTTLFNPAQLYCQLGYVCVPATTTTLVPSTSTSTSSSTTTPAPTASSTSTLASTTTLVSSTITESSTTSSTTTLSSTDSTISESTTIQDTTTTAVIFDANNFCASQASGRYAYPTGCISYVYCYILDGIMIGNIYECLGTTRFNPQLQYCEDGYTC